MTTTTLRVSGATAPVHTLGPGPAAGIWMQGCAIACPGCMSRETWSRRLGFVADVGEIAAWLDSTGLEYLTISGGEPTEQAAALCELIDAIGRRRWKITCYSGHELERLLADGDADIAGLIERLDLLIDGPYLAELHAPLRWRGSSNQRLHHLTDRIAPVEDTPAGLELHTDPGGSMRFIGVPDRPGFTDTFEHANGTLIDAPAAPTAIPFPTQPNDQTPKDD